MIIQSVCYISEQLESGGSVILNELPQLRTGLFRVVSKLIVESDIFLLESSEVFEIGIDLKKQVFELMDICIESQMRLETRRVRVSEFRLVLQYDPLIVLDETVFSGRYKLKASVRCLFTLLMAFKVSIPDLSGKSSHVQLDLMVDVLYDMKGIHYRDSVRKVLVHISDIWPVHVADKISDTIPLSCRDRSEIWFCDLLTSVYDHIYWLTGHEILDDKSVIAYL